MYLNTWEMYYLKYIYRIIYHKWVIILTLMVLFLIGYKSFLNVICVLFYLIYFQNIDNILMISKFEYF